MVLVYYFNYFKLFIILLVTEKGSAKQNILPEATLDWSSQMTHQLTLLLTADPRASPAKISRAHPRAAGLLRWFLDF